MPPAEKNSEHRDVATLRLPKKQKRFGLSAKSLLSSKFFALTHPPIALLLKTKAKVHIDRPVTDQSKSLFGLFLASNRPQFSRSE
jgi:hypothetical protein